MKSVAEQLRETIDRFMSADLPAIDWTYKASPAKWSKKEIIGHLIDSAQINLQRFVSCTYQENFKLRYDQVEWVEAGHYRHADINELLQLWELLNRQIARVISAYPEGRLLVTCDTGKDTVNLKTAEWLMQDYVDHLSHHLKQVL
jgi:hypothetical protein